VCAFTLFPVYFPLRWANTLYSKRVKDVKTNSLLTRIATTKGASLCELMKADAFLELCVADCVWRAVPQATKWQHIENQINAALISAGNGNRTRMASLEGWNFTIKLCPHRDSE
jgi:hypothetical protein